MVTKGGNFPMPTALYYDMLRYQPENLALLESRFNLRRLPDPSHDGDDILGDVEVGFAPLGYFFGAEKMDRMPHLKVIASNTTGHPHIDVDEAKRRGVAVVTLKDDHVFLDGITPTAELTWGLIIALTRNVMPAYRSFLDGHWDRRPFGGTAMLSRMSLGVIGLGRLGGKVAGYGKAFGMDVAYYDPFVDAGGIYTRYDDLHALIGRSNIVSLHVPHEPETTGMLGRTCFESMRPGSFFVNTARGELIDFDALLDGLRSGRLAGAGLDVFEGEFEPGFADRIKSHPLWQYAQSHDNLVITPHIGGSTYDAWRLTEQRTIERVLEIIGDGD
jgi:D-3-phosphoglycerate dehydrogenase